MQNKYKIMNEKIDYRIVPTHQFKV